MRTNIIILSLLASSCLFISAGLLGCGGGSAHSGPRGEPAWAMHAAIQAAPAPVRVEPFKMGRPDLVLLVTGRNGGQMEVCNCRGEDMAGGLARRSGMFISYRKAFPGVLAVDLGDFFRGGADRLQNDYVSRAYAMLKYDAIAMGENEFEDALTHQPAGTAGVQLPLLSTNPVLVHQPLPTTRRTSTAGGVSFFAVLGDEPYLYANATSRPANMKSAPALHRRADALKSQLAQVRTNHPQDVVIVIAHGDEELVEEVAQVPGVDLILRGHTSQANDQLQRVRGVPVAKIGGPDMVGVLAIKFAQAGQAKKIADVEIRLETVTPDWPRDHRVFQIYEAYAHAEMRRALDAERTPGLAYSPSSACQECHEAEYAGWQKSRHAKAYRTLEKAGRASDPNCLMCHTSGFGTEQGFRTIASTPELANVNCQDCHRFNVDDHYDVEFKVPPADEKVCTTCHTPVTDPNFSYEKKSKLVHPAE